MVEVWAASQSMLPQGFESFDLHLLGAVVQGQRVGICGPQTYGIAGPTALLVRYARLESPLGQASADKAIRQFLRRPAVIKNCLGSRAGMMSEADQGAGNACRALARAPLSRGVKTLLGCRGAGRF